MIQDFLFALFMMLVVDPAKAEVASALAAARVPAAAIGEVTACLDGAVPDLVDRAFADPWWGVSTAVSVATGLTDPRDAVADVAPACAAALDGILTATGEA
ncbi:hypothetical protein [Mongoliimonas terrestris]|uniref:hypothetical protein n=1 Tax=Mongoliimonas terrestris TaxID=1709001 RepID=UPI0009496373|nr:hypothetical protein [Mongoliimonas terrestris]